MGRRSKVATALIALCVVVRGATNRGTCVWRIATGSPPRTGTTTSVFELSGTADPLSFTSLPLLGSMILGEVLWDLQETFSLNAKH